MRLNPRLFLLSLLFSWSVPQMAHSQEIIVYDSIGQLEARIRQAGDTTLVINFWATWCGPCVEELPIFEELHRRYSPFGLKVILISLDFKSQKAKRLIPFLQTHPLSPEIGQLVDPDADSWIPRVDSLWDGAIPATWVIQKDKRGFHPTYFKDFQELEMFIQPFIRICPRPARR
ncbi:MAG: TlpA family protein disulfide reductase [Saprospiraceae bacterium]|nr:TlpA family protein disulfide reductase [Saprospiraceae bacterium]